jgi:tetratricopeptide (TPR) repeat protein
MNEARWDTFFRVGMEHYQQGDFQQAAEAFSVSLEEARELPSPDLRQARSLNNLGCALSQLGQLGPAVALQEEGLAQVLELLGPEHQLVAGARLNLASDYLRTERVAEAESLFRECLSGPLGEQAAGALAQHYLSQERLPEAAEVLEQALARHPDQAAQMLQMLTHIYDALGQTEPADAHRQRLLDWMATNWGKQTLAFAEVVASLAESLAAQERLLLAADLYGQAAESFAGCVPAGDARLIGCLLGHLLGLRDGGRPDLALTFAQSVDTQAFPPETRRRWSNEVGLVHFLLQDYLQARKYFEESLEIGHDLPMPVRISILFNLGSAQFGQGEVELAQRTFDNLSGLAQEHLPPEHPLYERIRLQREALSNPKETPPG